MSLAALAAALLAWAAPAAAQLVPWGAESNVLVDMSVLGGTGAGAGSAGRTLLLPFGRPSYLGDLLPPPPSMPRSRLLVRRPPRAGQAPETERITLKPPISKPKRTARRAKRAKPPARPALALKPLAKKPPAQLAKLPPVGTPPKPLAVTPPPAIPTAAIPTAAKPAAAKPPAAKAATPSVEAAKPAPAVPPPPALTPPPAAAPPTKAEPPKPRPAQQASLPRPAKKKEPAGRMVVSFKSGASKLVASEKKQLESLIAKLKADKGLRLQLLAYAGEASLSASKARRLSLSRALTVRSHLIDKGVRSTRIDVRALGNRVGEGSPSRVDLRLTER